MRKQYLKHENEIMAVKAHRPPAPSPSHEYALIDADRDMELPNEHNLAGVPGGDGLMQGDPTMRPCWKILNCANRAW